MTPVTPATLAKSTRSTVDGLEDVRWSVSKLLYLRIPEVSCRDSSLRAPIVAFHRIFVGTVYVDAAIGGPDFQRLPLKLI